jgi:hypothetical protein
MSIETIKRSFSELSQDEQILLGNWIIEQWNNSWDAEMQRDFSVNGQGHSLLEEVRTQIQKANSIEDGFKKRQFN